MAIHLPSSGELPYRENFWTFVVESLTKLKKTASIELLEETVALFVNKTRQLQVENEQADSGEVIDETSSCDCCCEDLITLREVLLENVGFLRTVLPIVCDIAMEMKELFPSGTLKILAANTTDNVVFNRRQIACLLSHMFFCTLLPSVHLKSEFCGQFVGDNSKNGPQTFQHLYTSSSKPTKLYVQALVNYFKFISSYFYQDDSLKCHVKFERSRLESPPRWECSQVELTRNFTLHLTGSIGGDDEQGTHIEMDFANKNVGFGTTGTQEELLLGTSPESCCVGLFNETLQANEALLITGVQKFASFTGYGSSVIYIGLPGQTERDWRQRNILAVDANEYIGDEKVQLRDVHLQRELNKAFCGFSMVSGDVVDTGHWGCGVFGGIMGLKALLQLMAASEAGTKLHFYCFGHESFHHHFQQTLEVLYGEDCTVGMLWKLIKEYEKYLKKHWCDNGTVDDVGILRWIENRKNDFP